jgi:hypothetical protein
MAKQKAAQTTATATAPAAAPAASSNVPARQEIPPAAAAAGTALAQKTRGLPILSASNYAFIEMEANGGDQDAKDLREAMLANLGEGGTMNAFDFDRIRVPAGGGIAWEVVDGATGETTVTQEIFGIISFWADQKSFWKLTPEESGGAKPPDCFSTDLVKGNGDPGILCAKCPNNEFGSAKTGTKKGKACKDTRQLFLMREGSLMPDLLVAPPTSLKGVRDYFKFLMSRSIPIYRALTRLTLVRDNNAGGTAFSKIACQCVGVLPADEFAISRRFQAGLAKMLGKASIAIRIEDLVGGGSAPDSGGYVEGGVAERHAGDGEAGGEPATAGSSADVGGNGDGDVDPLG